MNYELTLFHLYIWLQLNDCYLPPALEKYNMQAGIKEVFHLFIISEYLNSKFTVFNF
jgi:hypothetical protein